MSAHANQMMTEEHESSAQRNRYLAPRPRDIRETGLCAQFLGELVEKHLHEAGVLTIPALGERCALSGPALEETLGFLRTEGRVEVRAGTAHGSSLRYALTERGRASAQVALSRAGYVGHAPVALDLYERVVAAQSVRRRKVTRERLQAAFADVVLDHALLDRLGPAVNSGKAMFVYGHAGTGKTYVTQRLTRLMDDAVLVPHAVAVGETVIRVFDPTVHVPIEQPKPGVLLESGYDPRFILCRRPLVLAGGELTPDMLDVQYDVGTRQYRAPLQLKAVNGMLILDDLGRQRVPPQALLNRWIVPMEGGRDYLSLATGQHFSVPFDLLLVFSTNLEPSDLADEAFLRRIGYKINFHALAPQQYHAIWSQVCELNGVPYDYNLCQSVIEELHGPSQVPLLPCHPRDLISIALDRVTYLGTPEEVTWAALHWAWQNYFVKTND